MYEGGFDDFTVNAENIRNNPDIERNKRIKYAYLLATNPETFEIMAKNNVILFHGTKSSALPNILKYGMNSVDELEKKGIEVSTGEEWSRVGGKRNFISFTDDISTACSYAASQREKEAFGVLVGMSTKSVEQLKSVCVQSDLPELGIKNSVPLEHLKMLAVPKNKVDFVKKLVGKQDIDVVDFDMEDPFYDLELTSLEASRYIKQVQEKGAIRREANSNREFEKSQVAGLARSRVLSSIMKLYDNFIGKSRGRDDGKDAR